MIPAKRAFPVSRGLAARIAFAKSTASKATAAFVALPDALTIGGKVITIGNQQIPVPAPAP